MESSDSRDSGSSMGSVEPPVTSRPIEPHDYVYNHTLQGGSCSHYEQANSWSCLQPRTCSDCLLKEGCMISWFGNCVDYVTQDNGGLSTDFHLAQQQGLVMPPAAPDIADIKQVWDFPAFSAAYCLKSDPVCDACRQANFWCTEDISIQSDSRYCIGQDGCICIWSCEAPSRQYEVFQDCSPSYAYSAPLYDDDSSSPSVMFLVIVIAVGVSIVVALVLFLTNRRYQKKQVHRAARRQEQIQAAQAQREQSRITAVFGLASLNLSGWIQHRQDLITKEHAQLEQTVDATLQEAYASVETAEEDVGVVAAERYRRHQLQQPST